MEGIGRLWLQFRGALGFPAPVLPPCTHYLFNHLFMILEEPREKREWEAGLGRATPSSPLTPDRASNEQYLRGQLSVKAIYL